MLSLFPRGVLDEILNLIESVSEEFPSYSFRVLLRPNAGILSLVQVTKITQFEKGFLSL